MLTKYIERNKRKILPWVTDWTDPQDHIRDSRDFGSMTNSQWLWCHPSAQALIHFAPFVFGFLVVAVVMIYALIKPNYPLFWSLSFLEAIYIYFIIKRIREYRYLKGVTLYDLYMREYNDRKD